MICIVPTCDADVMTSSIFGSTCSLHTLHPPNMVSMMMDTVEIGLRHPDVEAWKRVGLLIGGARLVELVKTGVSAEWALQYAESQQYDPITGKGGALDRDG